MTRFVDPNLQEPRLRKVLSECDRQAREFAREHLASLLDHVGAVMKDFSGKKVGVRGRIIGEDPARGVRIIDVESVEIFSD